MAGQVDIGREAARHGEAVDLQALALAAGMNVDGRQRLSVGGDDLAAEHDAQAPLARRLDERRRDGVARVDQRGDTGAGVDGVEGRRPGGIVVGEERHAPRGRGGETVDVGLDGRGQHHAGTVVSAEDDRPVDRAGGEHGALRGDPPQTWRGPNGAGLAR